MQKHLTQLVTAGLLCLLVTACTLPGTPTPPAPLFPTIPFSTAAASPGAGLTASPTTPSFPTLQGGDPTSPAVTQVFVTQVAITQVAATQPPPASFCADSQPTALINSFKSALQSSNGTALASLVSPSHGMDARLYRDGTVVNYDQQHAKFLFETTFQVDWGAAPGSGLETTGSFHELIIPDLLDVFNKDYTLTCNQVTVGGTTYQATWPYTGINFYSVHYPGTAANGNMDWHTWLLGMHYANGKPYLYAIMQFKWEP